MSFLDELRGEEPEQKEPVEERSDFLGELRAKETPAAQQAETNTRTAWELQPEHEAKVYDLHKKSGYDVSTVRTNPSKVENQISGYKPGINPNLDWYMGGSVANGQPNTAISGDDHEALNNLNGVIDKNKGTLQRLKEENIPIGGVIKTAGASLAAGALEVPKQFNNLMDFVAPLIVDKRKLDFADKNLEKTTISDDAQTFLRGFYGDTKFEELVGSAGESMGMMGALFATGGSGAVLPGMAAVSGIGKTTEALGEGAGTTEAVLAGVVSGVTEYWTEKLPFDYLLDPGKKFIGKLVKGGIADMVGEITATTNEIFFIDQKILKKEHLTKDQIKQALIDTALVSVLMTSSTTTVTHPFVREKADGAPPTEPTTRRTQQEILPSAVEINRQVRALNKDEAFHEGLDEEHAAVQETLTQERSRDHSKEVLKSFDSNESVYISSDGVKQIFEQNSTEEAFEILESVSVDAAKARETIATGEDTIVPRSEITTLNQEEYNIIKDDVKEAPGAYTRREITDKDAAEDVENSTNILEEDIAIQKEIDTEIARLTSEIAKTKLPDSKIAGDAAVLLRGLAEKIQSFGLDPAEQLKNISFKRTAFAAFKERVGEFFKSDEKELSEKIKKLETRINKIDVTTEKGRVLKENLTFQKADIQKELNTSAKGVTQEGALFQAEFTETDELNIQVSDLKIRIDKLDPATDGALIGRLERQLSDTREKLTDTAAAHFDTFFQVKTGKRGAISIEGESKLIELFEGANLSTVLHEIGHVALLEYSAIEQSGKANDELKADMKTIREWVGAAEGADLNREQSEQFARGFEAYLREGKAPTTKLRVAFERFRQYLMAVYPVAKQLNVTLNKEVRQVFDRMVSANAEVERAAREAGFVAKTDAEMTALGMSDVDKFNAKKLMDKTVSKAAELLTRDRNRGRKENLEKWEKESKRELKNEQPIYRTIDDIIKEDNQLDRDTYLEFNDIADLPDRKIIKKDGKNIDMVAALYGFDDAQAMLESFADTLPLNEAVDIRVAQKQAAHDASFVVEDYLSDLKSYRDYQKLMGQYIAGATVDEKAIDEGIQRNIKRWETEAREQNPNATQLEIDEIVQGKIDEYRTKQLKPKALREAELKRLAKETMAAKTVKDAQRIDRFMAQVKKAGSDERRAILRKDWGAASTANELGRFNYEMASLSKDIRKEVDKVVDNAKRVGKLKPKETIKNEYKEAILHLISRYNLAPLSPRDPQTLPEYATLFAGDSFGRDGFPMPEFLTGGITNYRDMRMEQLRELDNAIRYLEGQGKIGKEKVLADGFTLVEDVAGDSTVVLDKMKPKKKWEVGSMMRKLSDWIDDKFAMLDSLEFTMKSADNYTNLGKDGKKGVLERYVIDPIKRGLNALSLQQGDIKEQLKPHLEQIRNTNRKWRKQFGRHINIEGVNLPDAMIANKQTRGWFDYQIWAIALNTGNAGEKSNRENLRNGYGMTDGEIDTILDMLTKEDMRAVQGIWDTVNSLYAQADAQFLKDNNYHLAKVEATPFTFKGEEFEGGYYPIKHDKNLSRKVKERHVKEDFFDNEGGKISTPYTNRGATNARLSGVSLPVRLNLSVIDEHFRDTLHYIHLTDSIRDADRITRYKDDNVDITASMSNVLGEKVYDTVRPALQHIANPHREGLDTPGASELEWLRGASTAFILAWNTGVALKQPLSTFGAIRDMGVKAYVNGFSSVLLSPAAHQQKMTDLSPFMKNRQSSFDRELKSAFLSLTEEQRGVYFGDTKVTWRDVRNFGFWQIRVADAVTVLPIWHGAFNDHLNSDQSNLLEAVAYADNIVRMSQPSAQPFDLSEWQRSGGWHRLFSQFQTFTVGKYGQRQRFFYRAWKQGQISKADYAWFNFMDAFAPLVASQMLFALLQGRDLGDEEEQKEMMAEVLTSWATMGVPVLGGIARSLSTGWGDPLDTPVLQTGNKLIRGVISAGKSFDGFENEREKEKAMWGIAHAASIVAGVPVSKIVARAQKGAKQKKGAPVIKYLVPAHK